MKLLTYIHIAILALLSIGSLAAQQYPITLAAQSLPPHTGNLAQLTSDGSNKIGVTAMLLDANEISYQARLLITIEGQGIILRSKPSMLPAPINLSYGTPLSLTGSDLSEYFDINNLDFIGYSRELYLQNGGLPDGQYMICFEAFDYDRNNEGAGSLPACTFINAQLLDPPVLVTPIDKQESSPVQQLPVQWQSMHVGGFPTQYDLEIYGYPFSSSLRPDQIIQNTQAIITKSTMGATSTILSVDDIQLDFGQRYLIRVRASDLTMQNTFKNDGWSQPQFFVYGSVCAAPSGINATVHDHESATIGWSPITGMFADYRVRFRVANDSTANWYEFDSSLPILDVNKLQDETTYEYQVQTLCDGTFEGPYSQSYTFTTDTFPYEPSAYECGDDYVVERPTNTTNLSELRNGDYVDVGGFEMYVRTASAGKASGSWNGTGQIRIGWLAHKVNVKFKNLYINTDYESYDGNVIAKSDGLSSIEGFKTPKEIAAEDSLVKTTFCGDSIVDSDSEEEAKTYEDNFYATHNPSGTKHFISYDPNNPNGTVVNDSLFYDPYDPYNSRAAYDPTDYSNLNNPYSEENPYKSDCLFNPYNSYNSYNPKDYDDPANPYSAENPYDPEKLADKCKDFTAFNTGQGIGGINLPIGLGKAPNLIVLDAMKFTPTGAVLNAYFSATIPGTKKHVAFKMKNMEFHPGGLVGEAKLQLAGDVTFNWKEKAALTMKGGKKSYIKFDCFGLTGVSLDMKVQFCRDLMVPIDPETWARKDGNEYVTSDFTVTMSDWGSFASEISISPFEIPKLKDWAFIAQSVVFDFSDNETPKSVTFPKKYEHPDVNGLTRTGKDNPAWTGFYMKRFTVKLPEKFAPGKNHKAVSYKAEIDTSGNMTIDSTKTPLTFNATDLLIDQTGFSGWLYGTNVVNINDGKIDTWAFSIDSVGVGIKSNQFEKAAFAGKVKLPPIKAPLGYDCLVQPGTAYESPPKYSFAVSLADSTEMAAFGAKLTLYKDSYVKIGYEFEEFYGTAKLNGKASFNPYLSDAKNPTQGEKDSLYIPNVTFQGFEISTRSPYLNNIGTWQYSSGGSDKLANFPLKINEFGMFQNKAQDEVAITIGAEVNFMGASEQGFAATGKISIICDIEKNDAGKHEWSFQRVRLDEFGIDIKGSAYAIAGKIEFYEKKPVYGSGFQGQVSLTVSPKFAAAGVFQVGTVDDYRYWFADALIAFNPGIAMGSSGLSLYGFGGGVSYKMKRAEYSSNTVKLPLSTATTGAGKVGENPAPATAADTASISMPDIGVSLSGIKYVPDKQTGYGIKAMVSLGTVTREVFNGDMAFEIILTDDGGVRSIGLQGEARMLTPPQTPGEDEQKPAIKAKVDMVYDFINTSFHADLSLYINVVEGLIHGAYPKDLAGKGVIHADKEDWYIHLGTPQKRIMISYDLSGLKNLAASDKNPPSYQPDGYELNTPYDPDATPEEEKMDWKKLDYGNIGLLFTAYLDAGTVLPAFPDVPANVQEILGQIENPFNQDDPRFASAGGLMFGVGYELSMPELSFLVFYAEMYGGAGFDMMLRDYGMDARCAGNENSNDPIGINGWYATGQMWAYIQATIGIRVKVFGIEGSYPIIDLGAAAVLQGRAPNPFWLSGRVGGRYNILGGLVSGNCSFKFEAGEKCSLVGESELGDIEIISSVSPDDNSKTNTDVFIRPQATFNLAMGEIFEVIDDEGKTNYYKANLNTFTVVDNTTGASVDGEISWNDNGDVIALYPYDILTGNSEYTMTVNVNFDKKEEGSDSWNPLKGSDGKELLQEKTIVFTTGPAPDFIPHHNIAYAYPLINQFNFLKDESRNGYIQLKQGQPYLFASESSFQLEGDWQQKVTFAQNQQLKAAVDLVYVSSQRRVNFAIPTDLDNNSITEIKLMNYPAGASIEIDDNVDTVKTDLIDDEYNTIIVQEKEITEAATDQKEKDFYVAHFRTSLFNTFADKMNALNTDESYFFPIWLDSTRSSDLTINNFGVQAKGSELFDAFDQEGYYNGSDWVDPLIQMEADLNTTGQDWFNSSILPNFYSFLPTEEIYLRWRDQEVLGKTPTKAIRIRQLDEARILTEDDITNDAADIPTPLTNISYELPYTMLRDKFEMNTYVADFLVRNADASQQLADFKEWLFVYPKYGNYGVNINYVLPGQSTGSSSISLNIPYGTTN